MVEIKENDTLDGGEDIGISCVHEMFTEFPEVMKLIENVEVNCKCSNTAEVAFERYSKILDEYQEQPHLLDPHLDAMLNALVNIVKDCKEVDDLAHYCFKYIYFITKVRGYKVVVRHLPHEVIDLEKILKMLEAQNPSDINTWYSRYVLLLWLSIIVMIPFHMSRIDSFTRQEGERKSIIDRILDVCKKFIIADDSCKNAAIFLASRFFIRTDVRQEHLDGFIDWCCVELTGTGSGWKGLEPVASILKHGKREDLLPYAPKLLRWNLDSDFRSSKNALIRKFSIKVVQRIGLTFLKARVATWRYKRGNRSLAANLNSTEGRNENLMASGEEMDEDDDVEVPGEIEEVVEELIAGLRDADTRVRYSAAKGLGRLSARLPREMADEILAFVLELFSPGESDGAWHGASFALAELGRRGLLLPSRLPDVVSSVVKALDYDDVRAHNFAVGGSVRDAACYVAWSLARAFDAVVMNPYVQRIASALVCVAVFDREINCRRAASAAFQENVGRQGTFPHGIDIVTVADYFALGSRNNAFLNISYFIAGFEEYTKPLIDHLIDRKINHWDASVRELSSKALGTLTKRDPQYILMHGLPQIMSRTSSINLDWRHGAVLALAEVILALSKCDIIDDKIIGSDALHGIEQLVAKSKNSGHFRGLGGELMWCAFLKMIEFASLAHLPLHSSPVIAEWRDSLEECLVHKEASVRERAAITLSSFLSEYYSTDTEQCKILVQHFIKGLSGNRTERLGSSLALGSLPAFALKGHTSQVLSAVAACSTCYFPPETVTWADCRKSALKALSSLTLTLKVATSEDEDDKTTLSKEQTELVYDCLLKGMEDYTKDGTGDIGAWVREAAMEGLVVVTQIVCVRRSCILTEELVGEIIARLLQLCVEPIGRLQDCAVKALGALLNMDPPLPNVPHGAELLEAIPRDDPLGLTHYTESETFPQIVKLVSLPRYTHRLLLGLISSTGSLTESLAKKAVNALAEHLQTLPHSSLEAVCATLVKVADEQVNSKRLSLPLLRSLEQIIGSGALGPFLTLADEQEVISLSSHILRIVRQELASSPSVYKRMAGAGVLCQLLQAGVPSAVTKGCLTQLAILLGCSASRVRTATAALLYEALLVAGEESFGSSVEAALSLLAETDWACSDVSVVRVSRNAFCNHLGLSIPRTAPRPT